MKLLLFLLLAGSGAADLWLQTYSTDLIGAIAHRPGNIDALAVLIRSPILTTIVHWALFLIGFGLLSLAMAGKRQPRPDELSGPRS